MRLSFAQERLESWSHLRRPRRGALAILAWCAITVLISGCKTNKVAAQPPVVTPPTPSASRPKQRQAASTATPATVPTAPPAAAPATPPRLGQILSPTEERQFNSAIDQSLGNARSSLNLIGGRGLSREQATIVQQINDFIQQARVVRTTDLLAAKGLADKADVLARDLLRSLR